MKIPRGKNRDLKDRWYENLDTWKHCRVKGCNTKMKSRFKGSFRFHKNKFHKEIPITPEEQLEKLYLCDGEGCKHCQAEGLESHCKS